MQRTNATSTCRSRARMSKNCFFSSMLKLRYLVQRFSITTRGTKSAGRTLSVLNKTLTHMHVYALVPPVLAFVFTISWISFDSFCRSAAFGWLRSMCCRNVDASGASSLSRPDANPRVVSACVRGRVALAVVVTAAAEGST